MNKTAFINKVIALAKGETLPASKLKGDWFQAMQADGVLIAVTHGSRRSWRAKDEASLRNYVAEKFDIRDLDATLDLLASEETKRADLVAATGDSKFIRQRTFKGFLVNCYQPIAATLNGAPLLLSPQEGCFTFIYDYEHFSIPENVVVVGIENPENFRFISLQRQFFEENLPSARQILFVSRYPQNQSSDLIKWLQSIPNQYVHFGDLDLAGIRIYLTEFYKHLGTRASFLIPKDFESRIQQGSQERYTAQYHQFHNIKLLDTRLEILFDCINKHHRGYDQEGWITIE